ncbi:MAG: diaminopimelate decarboxylase, partial [Bacilli bacterium]
MTILRNNIKLPEDFITPCYIYNLSLLNNTLDSVIKESSKYDFKVHFAIKSNANKVILKNISKKGLGADCVSGNEIKRALECGFTNDSIVYAGVGKSDKEIKIALENNISCFNCESMQEIKVINDFAAKKHKIVNIAIRINPNVDAHTHAYI